MSTITLQVGVKVVLKNLDGKVLLIKRSETKYGKTEGSWDIVGGRIEPGAGLLENLRREVEEGTRLELTSEPRLIAAQDIIPNPERHIVRLTYTAHTTGEPVLDTSENVDYRWVTFDELKNTSDLDSYLRQLLDSSFLDEHSWE